MTDLDEQKYLDVITHIEEYVSRAEVENATAEVIDRIKRITAGKNSAYGWSGGKDSLVIADLCQKAGIKKCFCLLRHIEFPEWEKWLKENAPEECEFWRVGFSLEYLAKHEELIFPTVKNDQLWIRNVQAKNIKKYMKEKNIEVLIVGRRKADGNSCGKIGVNLHKNGKIVYSPLYDWSNELLFAYLHYNKIELPFIYKWRRGFFHGTCTWAQRLAENKFEGYAEVYEINPQIVIEAAKIVPSAKEFLKCKLSQKI